ncbi:hypothetical protein [Exiguobacterium artemiae]|uniref:hypothetical protein n=1 Tax=Exiguobacterium artemiae TaxID=340145 RepID=UPI0029640A3C|nr:hypothetical protein [Exiguobacterium sibiricum]MDW2886450.1 hypothetical protein [Exiguobacterium sibiricum]
MSLAQMIYTNLKITLKISKLPFIFLVFIKIAQGFFPVINLLILQRLINNVQNLLSTNNESITLVITLLIAQFLMAILFSITNKLEQYIESRIQSDIELEMKEKMAKKMFKINYEKIESFEFQNLIQRIQGDMGYQNLSTDETGS